MRFESFIANRLKGEGGVNFSKPIIRIAVWGIALGIIVMVLTINIVKGFQKEVSDKVIEFNGPIVITKYTQSDSYENKPISQEIPFVKNPITPEIKSIQPYITKAGVVKVDKDIHGIVLKGIDSTYSKKTFKQHLVKGTYLNLEHPPSREILISKKLSSLLKKDVGDKIRLYFITPKKGDSKGFQQRMYPFRIKGIYETGLGEEFDQRFVICDIHYLRRLNYWNDLQVGGFEIVLQEDLDQSFGLMSEKIASIDEIKESFEETHFEDLQKLKVSHVKDRFPQIFDWLNLFDTHIIIVMIIIILVSVINMTAVLLIQIIEKTPFIGTLKALGAKNTQIQRIFIIQALYLIGKGLLLGNIIGLLLSFIQKYGKVIPLDSNVYYLSSVPVQINWEMLLIINIITVISSLIVLLLPARFISSISPSKSIRFN